MDVRYRPILKIALDANANYQVNRGNGGKSPATSAELVVGRVSASLVNNTRSLLEKETDTDTVGRDKRKLSANFYYTDNTYT